MTLFTKVNVLLSGVFIIIIFNLLLNYFNDAATSFSFRKTHNHSRFLANKKLLFRNLTVIPSNASIPNNSLGNEINFQQKDRWQTKLIPSLASSSSSSSSSTSPLSSTNLATNVEIDIKNYTNLNLPKCKYPSFDREDGPIAPNTTLESLDVVEAELSRFLGPGGAFQPRDCVPIDHVAIVVPFRDRYAHLSVFLRNIHPFLMRQKIAYRIFIIEQTNGQAFNRAAMMNIGFLESLKLYPWDCFIFHDVDLLPLDDRNIYNCPRQPRHMSVAIDTLNFKLPYRSIFGGVSAMTRKHFQLVNGFSNSFFGWGGEDDDMSNRLKHANLFIARYPINIARYMMLKHQKEKANPKRYENLVKGISKIEMDGLNSIKYDIYSFKEFPIFTWYLAELKTPTSDQKS